MPDVRFRLSPVAAMVAAVLAPGAASAVTYTVTNTADSGAGSLRQALTDINANCTLTPADIVFAIPGTGPFVLNPASPYPNLNCATNQLLVNLDGYTQPGSSPNTSATGWNGVNMIHLVSAFAFSPGCGLQMSDSSGFGNMLTVKGLEVRNFTYGGASNGICGRVTALGNVVQGNSAGFSLSNGAVIGTSALADRNVIIGNVNNGINVAYGGNVTIQGNLIGTQDGSTPIANGSGMHLPGAASVVDNNTISGNTVDGVFVSSDNGTIIKNNKIGTDSTGTVGLSNGQNGITVSGGSATQIQNNVISGNGDFGVQLSQVSGVRMSGNAIGSDVTGTLSINNLAGISATCSNSLQLTSNLISGNTTDGVQLLGSVGGGAGLPHTGNKIGITPGGAALANGGSGIVLDTTTCFAAPVASSQHFFTGNTVANNGSDGFALRAGVQNRIEQSSIYANGNKNININNTVGPLPNDPQDPDGGVNNQQNYPTIQLVTHSGGSTLIDWTLNSLPSSLFRIELYANPAPGAPAGKTFLAAYNQNTDAAGNFSNQASIGGLHDNISALAILQATLGPSGLPGDTSEFAPLVAVTASPAVTITPATLSFGNVVVGTTSPSQTSSLTSSGTANYQINTFDTAATCYGAPLCYGGPFTCSTNCTTGTPYAPSSSCTITAAFSPIALGPQTSTIYICDNALGSPHTISLTGTGVAPPPIQVNPSSQDFGAVPVGGSSIPIIFNFSNTGPAPAPISAPSTSGPFQVVGTNCGAAIPPSSSCNVNVSFTPTAAGPASGTLSMTSGTNTVTASLAGTGTVAPILVLPSPIDFGGVLVGSTATRTVTLTNTGGGPLTFSSMTVSGPFTLANNCPATLQPGQSCPITITADTSSVGSFGGTLTIVSDGGSGTVPLTVNVQQLPIPILKITPTTVGFGDRIVGSASASQRITILNEGGAAAALTGFTPSPDYIVTGNSCGTNLAPNASCFVDVAMRAVGFGMRVGQLVIGSNATGAPHAVSLAGTGCRPFSATGVRTGPRSNCRP